MGGDPTRINRDEQVERAKANLASQRGRNGKLVRLKERHSKGNGSATLIRPTDEELARHEEQASQIPWQWPNDKAPHALAGILTRVRIKLPGQWVLTVLFDEEPKVLLVPGGGERTSEWGGRVMVPLEKPYGDEALTRALHEALRIAGLEDVPFQITQV